METLILVFQILCAAVLAAGTVFSMSQLMHQKGASRLERFSYAEANDFETDFRRLARSGR